MKLFENASLIDLLVAGSGLAAVDSVLKQKGHFDIEAAIDAAIRTCHSMDVTVRDGWKSPFSREQAGIILELLQQFGVQSLMLRGITRPLFFKLLEGRIEKATRGSAAFDLFANEDVGITDTPRPVKTGVKTEFSPGLVAIIKEKSGLSVNKRGDGAIFLQGIEVKAGVIDSDFRDEWKVVLRRPEQDEWHSSTSNDKPFQIKKGMKIAQVILVELPNVELIGEGITIKDEVRKGGFGSTGSS